MTNDRRPCAAPMERVEREGEGRVHLPREVVTRAMAPPTRPERVFDLSLAPHARPAAVVLPLELGEDPALYVIERAAHLRDHAAELGFPGGKPEPGDRDLAATALRELDEETGVSAQQIELMGTLAPCPVITGKFVLHPFVGVLARGVVPRLASGEHVCVHRLSLARFLDGMGAIDAVRSEWRGRMIVSPFFTLGEADAARILYGASAALTHELIERLAVALDLPPLPLRFRDDAPWGERYAVAR